MAAPAEATTADFSGTYSLNASLSGDTDKILMLQGVGWLKRKAIGLASVTLHVKQFKDEAGVDHIDIKHILTGGIEGNEEDHELDCIEHPRKVSPFGYIRTRDRRIPLDEVQDEFLKSGWIPEASQPGVIHCYVASDTPKSGLEWTVEQVWGYELIEGLKRHVRRIRVTSSNTVYETKIVYDYLGPLAK